ncbi:MAG: hypothetical protein NC252_09375 [Roseburia sp.]|nr:hypothetical protein [Roseburia sp.]
MIAALWHTAVCANSRQLQAEKSGQPDDNKTGRVADCVINLAGKWDFQTDREDVGQTEQWYDNQKKLDDTMHLPASMPEQLKGDDISVDTKWVGSLYDSSYFYNPYMKKYRQKGNIKLQFFLTPDKHYVGVAWYKKHVEIASVNKKSRYVVYLERPHIETTLWMNGKKVGTRNSLSVAHEYDVTDYIHKGTNTLAIRIDNRVETVGVGIDSHSVTDQTQGDWNGIVGRMELREFPATHFTDVQVYPDVDRRKAVVRMKIDGAEPGKAVINLSAEAFNTQAKHSVSVTGNKLKMQAGTNDVEIELDMGDGMLLWDEFSPTLYRLTAEVVKNGRTDRQETVFGMRKFEAREKMFYVNNRQVQLRGTVENCDFPLTGYPPMNLEDWLRVFRTCREYGLNHVRFHSYCPPEAAFLAADMVGFYIQPEGPSWPNHGVKLGNGQKIDTYLMEETKEISKVYGNHPSFCMLACGNEPAGNWVKWVSEFVDYWKETDSRRVYTGASVGGGWAWQPRNEYHVKAGARGLGEWARRAPESLYDFRAKIDTVSQPYVSHETGQWCAFPNFDEIEKYTGVNKAKNFEIFRDLLRDNGMESRAKDFMMASGKLQSLCYKHEVERTLRTPDYAGFQLLALNDYSGQGTALVGVTDVFFDDKGYCSSKDFRMFCSPVVPLARIPKFTYKNNEQFEAAIEVAQFSEGAIKDAQPVYRIIDTATSEVLAEGNLMKGDIPVGANFEIGQVKFDLSCVAKPSKLNLTVSLPGVDAYHDNVESHNSWDFWVYPADVADNKGYVWITDSLDDKAKTVLKKGGKVLVCAAGKITYGKEVVQQFTPVFWNTSWFKMRPPHTTGIFVENTHSIFDLFPTDYHSDLQWWELVNRAQVMQFTDFPADFQPLVQSIDTWFISRKIGMLFEAEVLGGKLVMTTMDLTNNLDSRIAARQMRASILQYMNSDKFEPQFKIDAGLIEDLFNKVAPKVDMFTKDSPDELKPKKVF